MIFRDLEEATVCGGWEPAHSQNVLAVGSVCRVQWGVGGPLLQPMWGAVGPPAAAMAAGTLAGTWRMSIS